MSGRSPDIYEKETLEDGRIVALSVWNNEKTLSIRISEKDKDGNWKQLLSRNLWKSGFT